MGTTQVRSKDTGGTESVGNVDMKLEVIVIPVSDVDRAKTFYASLGWRLDADVVIGDARLIQFTPPGSGCSVQFGANITSAAPARSLYLVVSDIEAARDRPVRRGVEVSEVFHCSTGFVCRFRNTEGRVSGPAPDRSSYGSFASFSDPDGNGWLFQEVTTRRPGRIDAFPRRPSGRRMISRVRCNVPRPPTASTRSASARQTRTGPTGTPSTWCASRLVGNRLRERYDLDLFPGRAPRLTGRGEDSRCAHPICSTGRDPMRLSLRGV